MCTATRVFSCSFHSENSTDFSLILLLPLFLLRRLLHSRIHDFFRRECNKWVCPGSKRYCSCRNCLMYYCTGVGAVTDLEGLQFRLTRLKTMTSSAESNHNVKRLVVASFDYIKTLQTITISRNYLCNLNYSKSNESKQVKFILSAEFE